MFKPLDNTQIREGQNVDEEILIIFALFLIFGVPLIAFIGIIVSLVRLNSRVKKAEAEITALKQNVGFIGALPAAGAAVSLSKASAGPQAGGASVPAPASAAAASAAPSAAAMTAAVPAAAQVSPLAAPGEKPAELKSDIKAGSIPAPAPAVLAAKPQPEKPAGKKSGSDLESFFLDNIFSKLGALAIIAFIILFIKWASSFALVTPAMKVASVYLLS